LKKGRRGGGPGGCNIKKKSGPVKKTTAKAPTEKPEVSEVYEKKRSSKEKERKKKKEEKIGSVKKKTGQGKRSGAGFPLLSAKRQVRWKRITRHARPGPVQGGYHLCL